MIIALSLYVYSRLLGRHLSRALCESGGGRPGLPVSNSPYGLCGRKAPLNA